MGRDGRAGKNAAYSRKKVCLAATDKPFLVELLYQLSEREDCYRVKYSSVARDGMHLGRCFLTTDAAAARLCQELKSHPKLLVTLQDDDFFDAYRPNNVLTRKAVAADYAEYCRLVPELKVDDPLPSLPSWVAERMPTTLIASRGEEVVGYCYFQELAQTGYVRNIVVAPAARRSGVGRTLMRATADHLRARGKTSWRLNVRRTNAPALALYERIGMRPKYTTKKLLLPWAAVRDLPPGNATARPLVPSRDFPIEALFELPSGQLASARQRGRIVLEATSSSGRIIGVAVFDPKFPGAFPFRMKGLDAVVPMLEAMRLHVPTDERVNLVIEDDESLAGVLERVGATLTEEIVHMTGSL